MAASGICIGAAETSLPFYNLYEKTYCGVIFQNNKIIAVRTKNIYAKGSDHPTYFDGNILVTSLPSEYDRSLLNISLKDCDRIAMNTMNANEKIAWIKFENDKGYFFNGYLELCGKPQGTKIKFRPLTLTSSSNLSLNVTNVLENALSVEQPSSVVQPNSNKRKAIHVATTEMPKRYAMESRKVSYKGKWFDSKREAQFLSFLTVLIECRGSTSTE